MGMSARASTAGTLVAAIALALAAMPAGAVDSGPTPASPRRDLSSLAMLVGVDMVSSTDVWAVGQTQIEEMSATLVEHWDGTSWQQVASPSPGGVFGSSLTSVTAVAADDVWAVGGYGASMSGPRTLVLHWDGTTWSRVDSPNPSASGENRLNAVDAVSADDIWAVGWHTSSMISAVTLTEHWDGKHWRVVPSPNPSHRFSNVLSGVSAVSAKDVWAVGSFAKSHSSRSTLVAHWNGKRWWHPVSPSPGTLGNQLLGVSARATKDVWAVGDTSRRPGQTRNLIEHWNGNKWSRVPGPALGPANSSLLSVSADDLVDAWAVGYVETEGAAETLIMHWDGGGWTRVPSPSPGAFGNTLQAVDAAATDAAWAVGTAFANEAQADPLKAAWDGQQWLAF